MHSSSIVQTTLNDVAKVLNNMPVSFNKVGIKDRFWTYFAKESDRLNFAFALQKTKDKPELHIITLNGMLMG